MNYYVLVETEDGYTVVALEKGESAEDAAIRKCGTLVDNNAYPSYQEAYDALEQLEVLQEEDDFES